MAFSTSTAARWTSLSSSAGTPSGLCRVGIERRRCTGGQRGVAVTGSSSDHAGASFRASISFLRPPVSSRTAGLPRSGWGQQLSPWSLPMMTSHVKRWPASFGYHQVCSKARRARLHRNASATVCRLVCVARPPLPRAPLLRRRYPPSSLLRAHARVLWPPCPFDLGLVGTGLRRLCHPRLVHRTVLALTLWLLPKVSCPLRRVLARCIWSVSSRATTAFASKRWLGALQVLPQATSRGHLFSTLQAFPTITTLSFTCPPGRSRAATRGEGFVARACLGFVSSSQVEPVTRMNRPISGAGFSPASHRVLLAAPLALGDDAHATQGIGMTDRRQWQPTVNEAPHTIPKKASVLAAPRQRAIPEPPDLEPKDPQRVVVPGHSVIPDVSTHHRLQPLALVGDG